MTPDTYTFIHRSDTGTVTVQFQAVGLSDIFDQFKAFLQACTFTIDGEIDIVKDE